MSIKIPLLEAKRLAGAEIKGHPYPFQIALQSSEFIQGALFHTIFSNMASAEFAKTDGGMKVMEGRFTSGAYTKESYDMSWGIFAKYLDYFRVSMRQSVLISMNSHWDWYVRKLSSFIEFSRNYVESPELNSANKKDFARIGNCSISHQLKILQNVTGANFDISDSDTQNFQELSLIRNLGIHNRWEVDEKYLEKSRATNIEVDEVRELPLDELFSFHSSFHNVLHETCRKVSIKYAKSPDYP